MPIPANAAALLEQAQRLLDVAPRLAFEKASLLRDPLLRDRLRRDAFLAMSRRQPKDAAAHLADVIGARWLPAVHFAHALDIAEFTASSQPQLTRQLLLASAGRHPQVALREVRQYIELPYGPAIRDAARRAAPAVPADLQLLQLRQNPALAAALTPLELLRLAAAARTEEEGETALRLLRNLAWPPSADPSVLRDALALLAGSGEPFSVPPAVLRAAMAGIEDAEDPVAEAGKAAAILAVSSPELDDALPASPLGRLLRELRAPAEPTLSVDELFPNGLCLQRYIFHNDDDGLESFASFLASYSGDPGWIIRRTEAFVHLRGGSAERRIEIYANIPVDLQLAANQKVAAAIAARQAEVTRAMAGQSPTVLVHRGHDHHFHATRPFLDSAARLVFLGSCRGMANVEDVVTRCRRAQMIATRGIGATAVNDGFLRALNRALLLPDTQLHWDRFWASLPPTLAADVHFRSYVPPHRNPTARFLSAWYERALSAP